MAETVDAQVAAALAGTAAKWPTVTPAATYTPRPTYTAAPTFTPANTATPMPTYTLQATYTPAPTYTPLPSYTPSPTVAAVAVSQSGQGGLPATSAGLTFEPITIGAMRSSITTMTNNLLIRSGGGNYWEESFWIAEYISCPELIAAYEQLQGWMVPRPADADPQVQLAYDDYERAIAIYLAQVDEWVAGCRAAMARGEEVLPPLPAGYDGLIVQAAEEAKALLQHAIDLLAGS